MGRTGMLADLWVALDPDFPAHAFLPGFSGNDTYWVRKFKTTARRYVR